MPNFSKRIVSPRMEYTIPGRALTRGASKSRGQLAEGEHDIVAKDGWKARAVFATKMAMLEYGWEYDEDAAYYVVLVIRVGLGKLKPRSYRWEQIRHGEILPLRDPSVDRILKLFMDALMGVLWKRKAQVIGTTVFRKYVTKATKETEGVEVLIGKPSNWKELNHDLRNA